MLIRVEMKWSQQALGDGVEDMEDGSWDCKWRELSQTIDAS